MKKEKEEKLTKEELGILSKSLVTSQVILKDAPQLLELFKKLQRMAS